MSKYTVSIKELEKIEKTADYRIFRELAMKCSNMGVATAVLGGILRAWCLDHDEDFEEAVALMWVAPRRCQNDS